MLTCIVFSDGVFDRCFFRTYVYMKRNGFDNEK